jgi:acyl-coenzyme A thioesterase PaaI-like protein
MQAPNRLSRLVARLQRRAPAFAYNRLLSFAIGRVVPFVGTAGVYFEKMAHDEVILSLRNRRHVRNHIGQVHAVGLALLAETATGMALGMHLPDSKVPLIKTMEIHYTRRTSGRLRAVAHLDAADVNNIITQDKGEVRVPIRITDQTGEEVATCNMVWAWRPKGTVKTN